MHMRFLLVLYLIVLVAAVLMSGRPSYGHDCPLWQMGRLETFRALDKDQDHRLSLTEFMAQGWCQEATVCQCQEAARQVFQRLDQNDDRYLTLEEYQASRRQKQLSPR